MLYEIEYVVGCLSFISPSFLDRRVRGFVLFCDVEGRGRGRIWGGRVIFTVARKMYLARLAFIANKAVFRLLPPSTLPQVRPTRVFI